MEGFLKDGKLNPAIERTQKGFYSVFASWILEDNLPSGADWLGVAKSATYAVCPATHNAPQ